MFDMLLYQAQTLDDECTGEKHTKSIGTRRLQASLLAELVNDLPKAGYW